MRFAHLALANVCDAAIRKDPNGPGDGKSPMERLNLKVGDMAIVDSSPTSITLQMKSNFTNPTNYTATIPYFNKTTTSASSSSRRTLQLTLSSVT